MKRGSHGFPNKVTWPTSNMFLRWRPYQALFYVPCENTTWRKHGGEIEEKEEPKNGGKNRGDELVHEIQTSVKAISSDNLKHTSKVPKENAITWILDLQNHI